LGAVWPLSGKNTCACSSSVRVVPVMALVPLRRAKARTRKALIRAMGQALSTVTIADSHGFFVHCGYRAMGQLL
jgi:hypothetical protein